MKTQTPETWRPIPNFDGYDVSDAGRIRSWKAWRGQPVPRLLKPLRRWSVTDHLHVALFTTGGHEGRVRMSIHRAVLLAFVGEPQPGQLARHLNDIADDNRLVNLAWGTNSENHYDQVRNGRHPMANKTHCINGHEFTEENTKRVIRKKGTPFRMCRTCDRNRNRRGGAAA